MTRRFSATGARLFVASLLATLGASALAANAGATTVIYNNLPAVNPGNVVSQAFEATQLSQFGGQVELAGPNSAKTLVVVGMSSWACQTGLATSNCSTARGAKFEWPVTLHIYSVGTANAVGTEIAKLTKTFKMPYRPSASPKCTGESAGAWLFKGECLHGKYFKIKFLLKGVVLPSKAIISVSFNTSDYGEAQRPQPCDETEAGCPYDSLNVGLTEPTKFNVKGEPEPVPPSIGSDPAPEDAYQNSLTAENYCDKGLQGTGTFRLDDGAPPCWSGYQPLFEVIAK